MRTNRNFFDYLGKVDIYTQVENDIRILTKKSKKRNNKVAISEVTIEKDSYEQIMDTSKYDQILSELTI